MGMHPVQVIAVTGGKGGVGKTNVSVNLSMALADLGRRVMLMDADLGLALARETQGRVGMWGGGAGGSQVSRA